MRCDSCERETYTERIPLLSIRSIRTDRHTAYTERYGAGVLDNPQWNIELGKVASILVSDIIKTSIISIIKTSNIYSQLVSQILELQSVKLQCVYKRHGPFPVGHGLHQARVIFPACPPDLIMHMLSLYFKVFLISWQTFTSLVDGLCLKKCLERKHHQILTESWLSLNVCSLKRFWCS